MRATMIDATLDHVAIAVRDIRASMHLYSEILGAPFLFGGEAHKQGFRWAQFRLPGGGKFELVTPLGEGFVSRFLDRHGEGVHHVTMKVPDIHRAIAHLTDNAIPLFSVWTSNESWKEAFVHPKDANGVLLQFAQSAWTDEEVATHHLSDHPEDAGHRHIRLADL
jgi:methylmalonyl-CoA/ethylmalonyl-CoA epimerase